MSYRWLVLSCVLVACGGGDDPSTDTGAPTTGSAVVGADPDVNTFVPSGYRPANPTRLVYLGDSITAGYGSSTGSMAYPALLEDNDSSGWPGYDDLDLQSTYPGLTEVIDVSRGGATTDTMLNQQLDNLEDELGGFPVSGETIVVFTIGGNDAQLALNPLADADEIMESGLANMEEIVDWLLDPGHFTDGVRIYGTNIYEPTDAVGQYSGCFFGMDFAGDVATLDSFNDDLRDLASDKGIALVDLRGHFLGHGFYHDDPENEHHHADDPSLWMDDDCVHPNDRGHHEIRRLFHAAIEETSLSVDVPI